MGGASAVAGRPTHRFAGLLAGCLVVYVSYYLGWLAGSTAVPPTPPCTWEPRARVHTRRTLPTRLHLTCVSRCPVCVFAMPCKYKAWSTCAPTIHAADVPNVRRKELLQRRPRVAQCALPSPLLPFSLRSRSSFCMTMQIAQACARVCMCDPHAYVRAVAAVLLRPTFLTARSATAFSVARSPIGPSGFRLLALREEPVV